MNLDEWNDQLERLRNADGATFEQRNAIEYRAYRSLTEAEAADLAEAAADSIEARGGDDFPDDESDVVANLAALVPGSLRGIQLRLAEARQLFIPEVYLGAEADVTDELMKLTRAPSDDIKYNLISCLAFIGDEIVQKTFAKWRKKPPSWLKDAQWQIDSLGWAAGWCTDRAGKRQDLFCRKSFKLQPDAQHKVVRFEESGCACEWCGKGLRTLLELDEHALGLIGLSELAPTFRVHRCQCTEYATTFARGDREGSEAVLPQPKPQIHRNDQDYWDRELRPLGIGSERLWPFETGVFVRNDHKSQLGGHPAWEQNPEYPTCPLCGVLMTCIAQVAGIDSTPTCGVGTDYAFACLNCKTSACLYQQD